MLYLENKDEYFGEFKLGQMNGEGIYWIQVSNYSNSFSNPTNGIVVNLLMGFAKI